MYIMDVLRFRTQRVDLGRHLHKPLSGDEVLEQHHTSSAFQYDLNIAAHDRLSPPLVVHAPILSERLDTFLVSRFPLYNPWSSLVVQLHMHSLWDIEGPKSVSSIPHSALRISALGFKVDQRIPPLGKAGPWLHLDDVIQHRPSD